MSQVGISFKKAYSLPYNGIYVNLYKIKTVASNDN